MRSIFIFKPLVIALATLSVSSVALAAGLDRSGQDTTAFFQEGTYAEAAYTYIDADVTGKDSQGNKIKDIAKDYDFFRYGVKTDIDDTFSIGVLYDEPWGAAADYHGDNDFVGVADRTGNGVIQGIASNAINNTKNKIADVSAKYGQASDPTEKMLYGVALQGLNNTLNNFEELKAQPTVDKFNEVVTKSETAIQQSEALLLQNGLQDNPLAKGLVGQNKQDLATAKAGRNLISNVLSVDEETKVEVRTQSLTGLLGMKLGQNKNFQIYGGPVAQRLKADVSLRGNAYETGTGYDLSVNPDVDYGWLAGLQYNKPEIALKASLTYRSEIDHDITAGEVLPLAPLGGLNGIQSNKMEITTPESVNFDFQTGINPTTLATAKVRWVPWSDFQITPPLYNQASKRTNPKGLNLVDYTDDQWLVELGLAKRLTPSLAVTGTVGWDSGAGDPTTSLGPIEGYYSVGLGAKYNVTENWAVSAGGKYLMFGDAEGRIPTGSIVSDFEDNDGFAAGVKLSYQSK